MHVSRGTNPSGYQLPDSQCIQPPFNYIAGLDWVFHHHVLGVPSGHHLMMKHLLQEVWIFGFVILIFLFFLIQFFPFFVTGLYRAVLFIYLSPCSAENDVLSSRVLILYLQL